MRKKRDKQLLLLIICIVIVAMILAGIGIHKHKEKVAEEKARQAQIAKEKEEKTKLAVHLTVGLKGSEETLVKEGETYVESGAFCIDDRIGSVKTYKIKGKVDTTNPGTYKVTYTFNSDGAEKSITRKVNVVAKDKFKEDKNGVPVLMYHYVYTQNDVPENLNGNYIKDTDLEAQLKYLKENNYYFPSFSELRAYVDGKISLPENSVVLSFDDGQFGFLEYGLPLLDKYKVPATSFLIGINEGENKIKNYHSPYVSYQSHSFDMHHGGGNIGHGGIISAMTTEEIMADLKRCAELTGNNDAFAYPYGDVTPTAQNAIKKTGISCAFTTENAKIYPGDDFTALSRVRVQGTNSLEAYISSL